MEIANAVLTGTRNAAGASALTIDDMKALFDM